MTIFEVAKQLEVEGEQTYRELARNSGDAGLAAIFNLLADDEVKHLRTFEAMEKGATDELPESQVWGEIKAIFVRMKQAGQDFSAATPQVEVYRRALENERNSIAAYQRLLPQMASDEQRGLLEKIIREEQKHAVVLENMIEFINRPATWLEDAEFNHLEAY